MGLYRGSLEFRPGGAGGVQTIDAVDLEDYVRGVISAEMPSSWSPEALKAQAVAARTYAITTSVSGNGYSLYPDTRSQMYTGVAAETPATNAAVAATRGQVVTYNGRPVATYFFASSGGYTEDVQNVWLGSTPEPWLQGVPDPYDGVGGDPYHHWSDRMSIASAQAKLGSLVKGKLIGIQVTRHGVSPRVVSAQVVGTRGRTSVTGPQLQGIFGLMSTYMSFGSVSSSSSSVSTTASTSGGSGGSGASGATSGGAAAAAPLASTAAAWPWHIARTVVRPALTGTIFPAERGTRMTIELRTRHGWRAAGRAVLGSGGSYSALVSRAGVYRVDYRGLLGPAVRVR